jgi:multidrug efflux pump subunit AcrB
MSSAQSSGGGLIGWFVRNPVAANLLMVVLLIGGLLAATSLRSQVFPTIEPDIVTITVPYPGATPAEVEEGITRRVEEAVLGVNGVKRVRSSARENVGVITVETNSFADRQLVKQDIETEVERLADFPPTNAEEPVVAAAQPLSPVLTLVVTGEVGPLELRRAAEQIERDLLSQPGISLVSLSGDRDYEISIEVEEDTLRRFNLSFSEVAQAVRDSSLDLAGGSLNTPAGEILLRTNERRLTGEEFETVVVRSEADGSAIRVDDIATVRDGFVRERVTNTYNGDPAILVNISQAEAEDVRRVKGAVDEFLEGYDLPPGIEVASFKDQTLVLEERINLLLRNALFGFALVFLFLVLMLDIKLAMWVCIGIATAFLGGFMLFGAAGVTINVISLFALILVLGLVVDDAVVIGENIDAVRADHPGNASAAIAGVKGVLAPVLVGVMTTIAAFAPLLVTGGTFGEVARGIPIVVICVLLISMVEAFLILPSHLSHGGHWSRGALDSIQRSVAGAMHWLSYSVVFKMVRFAGRFRYATLAAAFAFVFLSLSLVPAGIVRVLPVPQIEGNEISVAVTMPQGVPFERTEEAVAKLRNAALAVAERAERETGEIWYKSIAVTAGGRASTGGGPGTSSGFTQAENIGQIQIELVPFGERRTSANEIERQWREELGRIEGAERVTFSAQGADFGADIEYEFAAPSEDDLIDAVEAAKVALRQIEGVNQIEDSFDLGKREFVFELTSAGIAAGLRPSDIARQVRQAYFGDEVQRIQRGREEVRVFVRYPEDARRDLSSLDDFRIRLADGAEVPLFTVANVREGRAYATIERIDGRRIVSLIANVDEAVTTPNDANAIIQEDILPALEEQYPGLRWAQAGASRELNEDFASLGRAMVIALLVIFALVASQLRSYLQPIAIMISIPLGLAGAVIGHWVLGFALSFISVFGMVALAGVAVNASVVLIDLFNQNMAKGEDPIEAAANASARRFRPIVLTTLTTALGLGPLLFETSPQAQFLIPMGISLGFGILISGLMVVFVTPAIALVIEDIRRIGTSSDSQERAEAQT